MPFCDSVSFQNWSEFGNSLFLCFKTTQKIFQLRYKTVKIQSELVSPQSVVSEVFLSLETLVTEVRLLTENISGNNKIFVGSFLKKCTKISKIKAGNFF